LSRFLAGAEQLHRLEIGDYEPPVITVDAEARS
jgi:hypothetical protein